MYFQTKSKEKTFMGVFNVNPLSNVRSGQNLNRRSIPRNNLFLPEIITLIYFFLYTNTKRYMDTFVNRFVFLHKNLN